MIMSELMTCKKHKIAMKCIAGRNAHPTNWYCPECDKQELLPHKQCREPITTESVQAIVAYIDDGDPDIAVIKSELGELILSATGEYWETNLSRSAS